MLPCSIILSLAMASATLAVNTTSVPIRLMAAGASVTFGVGSTTGNSYRKDLLDLMTAAGMTVEYVGTKHNGDFTNNAVQATSGNVISQIAAGLHTAVPQFLPNLVLIDAGTNNCNKGKLVPDAGANITNMVNDVFAQSPGATVILTTVLVNSKPNQDACRTDENRQIEAVASTMQAAGAKLVLVNMRGPDGPLVTDLADGRHPNDAGYVKMANVWFQGIQQAVSKDFISAPAKANSTTTPAKSPNNSGASSSAAGKLAASTGSAVASASPSSAASHTNIFGMESMSYVYGLLSWLSINYIVI